MFIILAHGQGYTTKRKSLAFPLCIPQTHRQTDRQTHTHNSVAQKIAKERQALTQPTTTYYIITKIEL